jgi:hypothetical protein
MFEHVRYLHAYLILNLITNKAIVSKRGDYFVDWDQPTIEDVDVLCCYWSWP